ncbi:MAG: Na+/H+ antiporter subunit E [Candidatus Omnitrophota bacterium]|nr:Na+/H+ antiporter subunit E [Candidatus Omnitrophota bacterium]
MIKKVILFIFWFAIWCGLSYPLGKVDIIIGVLTSAFVTYMTIDLAAQIDGKNAAKKYSLIDYTKRFSWFLVYVPVFLWECLKANIDVAGRVLHPDLPIRPGTVAVKVNLKSDIGLTFLANSITLTPGTTSVDIDKEKGILYVHWIYVREDCNENCTSRLPVVEKFENILRKVFE